MGIELRRVVEGWQHPTRRRLRVAGRQPKTERRAYRALEVKWAKGDDAFRPLHDQDWLSAWRYWQRGNFVWYSLKPLAWVITMLGVRCGYDADGYPRMHTGSWEDHAGPVPLFMDYRPRWKNKHRTHYQLYENTSEGTPISPVCKTLGELAAWCALWCDVKKREVWNGTEDMGESDWNAFLYSDCSATSFVITPEHGVESGVRHAARETRKDAQ